MVRQPETVALSHSRFSLEIPSSSAPLKATLSVKYWYSHRSRLVTVKRQKSPILGSQAAALVGVRHQPHDHTFHAQLIDAFPSFFMYLQFEALP